MLDIAIELASGLVGAKPLEELFGASQYPTDVPGICHLTLYELHALGDFLQLARQSLIETVLRCQHASARQPGPARLRA